MKKSQKNQILDALGLLDKAHEAMKRAVETGNQAGALTLLEQCQDSAIQIGGMVEESEGEDFATVGLLENYCEQLYQTYELIRQQQPVSGGKLCKNLRKDLIRIENSVKNDIPVKMSAVFLPYKASMWDSLESVWRAADADPDCDAYVIPIPYFDKNSDGTLGQMHYEGDEFPENISVTGYEDYDFETERPDVIFIHNPYDECNFVTSVHPFFYTKNLKKFTDCLVYIPYFILGEDMYESMCITPGTVFSDVVIAHSVSAREDYVRHLKKFYRENAGMQEGQAEKMLREKIRPLGSPKIDKIVNGKREDYPLPKEWKKLLEGKKAVLYNTGVSGILHGNEQELKKIKDTIAFFAERDDVALWWRPHPLTGGTMQSMRPALVEEYQKIVEEYRASGIGIFDDTADLHRALLWTDMYYGDDSSLVYLYGVQGKPIVMQNIGILTEKMENGQNNGICHKVSCVVSEDIYITPLHYNRLYQMNLAEKTVTDLGEIPQEWQMESALYSNIIFYEGVLWFVPSRAHALAGYHPDTEKWERYELSDRISNSMETNGTLYMISSDYRHLWRMNLRERRLEQEEISYDFEKGFPLSEEYYNDDLYMIDGKLYYLIMHSNLIAIYDLERKQAQLQPVGSEGGRYQRMLQDEKGFWLIPRDKENPIICWKEEILLESGENCYPKDFSFTWGFSHAMFRDDGMWIFPLKGNMILRLDQENMTTVCALKFEEERNVMDVQVLSGDRFACFTTDSLSQTDCRVTVLDAENRILDEFPVTCPDKRQIVAENIFERLDKEKYHSVSAYRIKEAVEYAIPHICDSLLGGKEVYREEQNYFRSLYANSDGTAGACIWEGVKVWLN